ncbi:MAG: TlpA family protein disulfide reductase [Alphaproteobacteria bacterium]|nr:TlpA family protein disulfide reductase [Alphaproteobacteria bacterium]
MPQQYAPKAAPPFVFEDRGGAQHALSDYHGHYVLLNFWATWCSPCVHELPSLDALQARFGSRLTILPVSENSDGDGLAAFYRAHGIAHLQIARDPADIAPQLFHLSGVPTTILIDPQGRETARIKGGTNWTSPAMTAFLTAWMKNP